MTDRVVGEGTRSTAPVARGLLAALRVWNNTPAVHTARIMFVFAPLALLTACRDPPRPQERRPVTAPTPSPREPSLTARADVPAAEAPSDGGASPSVGDGGEATGEIRVFRVGNVNCIRDPARERLGASVHGAFGTDRMELEVRNVRHTCTPGPVFTATVEGTALHVRYELPAAAVLARCACRHDQFLQIVGVAPGEYDVDLAPVQSGDAGAPIATGRVVNAPPR